jgi:hypothetical protein
MIHFSKGYIYKSEGTITLKALREYNAACEAEHDGWQQMEMDDPERETIRRRQARVRADGRKRVAWWQSVDREQEAAKEAAGYYAASTACDEAEKRYSELRWRVINEPSKTFEGAAIKLALLQQVTKALNTDNDLGWLKVAKLTNDALPDHLARLQALVAGLTADLSKIRGDAS